MSVREILRIGHPVLRQDARELEPDEVRSTEIKAVIDDLVDTMRAANGAGLAATQIGEPVQVAVVEVRAGNPRYPYKPPIPLTVLVNPVVVPITDETFANFEGCLSVPNLRGVVDRFVEVRVSSLDRHGDPLVIEARGLSAGTFQHETDHLHGTMFIDRVTDTRSLCTWEEFARWHEASFTERAEALVARFGS
jgi:peptide deformylase